MNIVRDFRIVRLIAALKQDIKNAEELLDYIDGELSHCRDEEKESAFRRMRPRVLQALDQKEFMRDKLKAELEELKDMFCTTTKILQRPRTTDSQKNGALKHLHSDLKRS
ncbi:hypothetical protein CAPTEDRAFT_204602 [Capitella teleta]|uniref:Uncharacterized protein n=1 Tax=Capitella teleta TaxID=283909 RepID=R7T5X8_CAPTE|nr:hypothetical protein CAPTEDRAFT_204602 [Capitella teleta]|eukprot:ELT88633.1 hypothetical protein CAPTEDRAFT_204602 [Capitella teleta]